MHTRYKISEIAHYIGVDSRLNSTQSEFDHITIDSRQIRSSKHTLFIAIKGKHHDGHDYIEALLQQGVLNFIVTNRDCLNLSKGNFILVNNSVEALQKLAKLHREKFDIPLIGITGSNGKTVVKDWLFQFFSSSKKTVRSPKSYNSQIGVPLSLWNIQKQHELAIIETGISEPGEMEQLQSIVQPQFGIFTNIGDAHSENFASKHQKIQEKLTLFKQSKTIIFCADHNLVKEELEKYYPEKKLVSWSFEELGDISVKKEVKALSTSLTFNWDKTHIESHIPYTDLASIENACHCVTMSLVLGITPSEIRETLPLLTPIAMRLELKKGVNQTTVINDVYSADVESLKIALDFTKQQSHYSKRTAILSSLEQSASAPERLYAQINESLEDAKVTRLIGIGKEMSVHRNAFRMEKQQYFPSTAALLNAIRAGEIQLSNETILVKGARKFEFERISNLLQAQNNESVLEISLNQLINNLNAYRNLLKPQVKIMAMVKAYGYGAGAAEIAKTLEHQRVDYLAVAYPDAGIDIRKSGIEVPIMVMSPRIFSYQELLHWNLEPEISNKNILNSLIEFANQLDKHQLINIHVKIETGMNRLGFTIEEIPWVIEQLKKCETVKVTTIFSHLADSGNPKEDAFTQQQIDLFEKASSQLIAGVGHAVTRHILNTSGIERFPHAQFDMVRLGIGLYGIGSTPKMAEKLKSIGAFKSSIIQIKIIQAGQSIGYGRSEVVANEMKIAVVPVGYADGLNRKLSNGIGSLIVKGTVAPIVGKVCMDMCMIDVSNLEVEVGEEVIVFDEHYPPTRIAEQLDTIPYEVLTSISARVKRVYFQE